MEYIYNSNDNFIDASIMRALLVNRANEDLREYLTGIHFNAEDNRLESSNGHVALTAQPLKFKLADLMPVNRPSIIIKLEKIPPRTKKIRPVFADNFALLYCYNDTTLIKTVYCEIMANRFPNISKVIPEPNENNVKPFVMFSSSVLNKIVKTAESLKIIGFNFNLRDNYEVLHSAIDYAAPRTKKTETDKPIDYLYHLNYVVMPCKP